MLKDGYFRKRKFAHIGSETSLDLFADNRIMDTSDEHNNLKAEAMYRKEQLEKEEFLSEMRVSDNEHTSYLIHSNSTYTFCIFKERVRDILSFEKALLPLYGRGSYISPEIFDHPCRLLKFC